MYFNTLIIMNEDALGYGNRSMKPSGYCKLTMPNRVSCYVQGLRQLPKGQIYKLYLTSKSKQQSVEVGMLQVGANGNKETRWVMNPASINNTDINAEEIDGAFIIVSGDDIKGNVVPLVGFSSEPYIWEHLVKNNKEIVNETVAKTEVEKVVSETVAKTEVEKLVSETTAKTEAEKNLGAAIKPNVVAEADQLSKVDFSSETAPMREIDLVFSSEEHGRESGQEPSEEQVRTDEILELKKEVIKLNQTIQESRAIIEALQRQSTKREEVSNMGPTESAEPIESIQPTGPTEPLEKVPDINDYINNFLRRFQAAEKEQPKDYQRNHDVKIKDVFEKRIPINPFEAQDTGIKWVRITHEDLVSLLPLNREWTNQDLMVDAHREYKHFILGRDELELTYYIGIPGAFDPAQESVLNIDKIERFSCCYDVPPRVGEAGYWIARI